jgi:nucleoside-diphosphate-sugar epimerase
MRHPEAVTGADGIALRYGGFYGAAIDALVGPVRKRPFPIVGDGGGYTSWLHLDDAAAATVLALDHDGPGIYNITDDEPAPVREWLPGCSRTRSAPSRPATSRLAGAADRGRRRSPDGNRRPRRLDREGQARTRLDAALPELAAGLR